MSNSYVLLAMIVATAATVITRALPFLLFREKKIPSVIQYLGTILPGAIMATLIVYCLKSVDVSVKFGGMAELIAIAATAAVHLWKRNVLLSVAVGTVLYMLCVQVFFA